MLVDESNFSDIILEIAKHTELGIDTETTGLHWWKHRLFTLQIATKDDVYFFPHPLPAHLYSLQEKIFSDPTKVWYIANAKFDMHFLANSGLSLGGRVVCLTARERVIRNNYFPVIAYKLDSMAHRYLGVGKVTELEEYILKNKLYKNVLIPGKKKVVKELHFEKVPLPILQPYAETDARLHLNTGLAQIKGLNEVTKLYPPSEAHFGVDTIANNEEKLTKTLFHMERAGVKVDVDYISEAMVYENRELVELKERFEKFTGFSYQDSSKLFVQAFGRLGLKYNYTEKGNPCFDSEALENVGNPVSSLILDIRGKEKKIGTYYSSFLYYKDAEDTIHPNVKQWGTETGRMSCAEPNLQNLSKEEKSDSKYLVRRCFIPRKDFCFVEIDYRQQEFRLLVDYANEEKLISAINSGVDPHEATAKETGLTRTDAKTINFGLLYGMGVEKLAKALGCSTKDAEYKRYTYFSKMKNVERFIRQVGRVAKTRGYVQNWAGRVCQLADVEFSYILLNHLIQGGGADVIKIGMNRIADYLSGKQSRMLLQVHDSILFEIHKSELSIVPNLQYILENVYIPRNGIQLLTSVEHSWVSWSKRDMKVGLPVEKN